MRRKADIAIIVFGLLALSGVLIAMSVLGANGRTYSDQSVTLQLSEPSMAVSAWKDAGVRGRVLVHFDRNIRAGEGEDITNENYIYRATTLNLVRKIYHVIPDASWQEVSDTLSGMGEVGRHGNTFRLTLEGTPIVVLRIKDTPVMEEQVLININGDYWSEDDLHRIRALVDGGSLRPDVITISGSDTDGVEREVIGRDE